MVFNQRMAKAYVTGLRVCLNSKVSANEAVSSFAAAVRLAFCCRGRGMSQERRAPEVSPVSCCVEAGQQQPRFRNGPVDGRNTAGVRPDGRRMDTGARDHVIKLNFWLLRQKIVH